jgi:hypothetical protein
MVKKKPLEQEEIVEGNNHQPPAEVTAIIESFRKEAADVIQEMRDVAEKRDGAGQATLFIAKSMLDTDRKHLPEMTRLYLRSVRPCSLADMSSSVFDPYVQAGIVTLGQIRRDSVYRHMRSVGGDLLNKAAELAMEQLRVSDNQEPFEEASTKGI